MWLAARCALRVDCCMLLRSLLRVVCGLLLVAWCSLFDGCGLLLVRGLCYSLIVVLMRSVSCALCPVRCLSTCVVCCLLFWCMLLVVVC